MMMLSIDGLELIKEFEGFDSKPYMCSAGVYTIGYGTTRIDGVAVTRATPHITKAQAEKYLLKDVAAFEAGVNRLLKVPVNQNQFDALVSFAYNVGLDEDADTKAEGLGDSTLLRKLNAGDYIGASKEFDKWVYAGGRKLRGLARRRDAEQALFLKPLEKSRTLIASSVGSAAVTGSAALDMVQHNVLELSDTLSQFSYMSDYIKYGLMALSLISFAIVVYARIDDYRKGAR